MFFPLLARTGIQAVHPSPYDNEYIRNISHASHNQHKYMDNPASSLEYLDNPCAQPSFLTFASFIINKATIKTMTNQNKQHQASSTPTKTGELSSTVLKQPPLSVSQLCLTVFRKLNKLNFPIENG
jgi:hypothetical protein